MKTLIEPIAIILLLFVWLLFTPWLIVKTIWCAITNTHRAWRILVGLDVAANAVFNDDEIQTISARAAKARNTNRKWGCRLCKIIELVKPKHCNDSLED